MEPRQISSDRLESFTAEDNSSKRFLSNIIWIQKKDVLPCVVRNRLLRLAENAYLPKPSVSWKFANLVGEPLSLGCLRVATLPAGFPLHGKPGPI